MPTIPYLWELVMYGDITMWVLILLGSVTKTATPTFDLLVGFSIASKLETENICPPFLPSKSKPDILISLNFVEINSAKESISFRVSKYIQKIFYT